MNELDRRYIRLELTSLNANILGYDSLQFLVSVAICSDEERSSLFSSSDKSWKHNHVHGMVQRTSVMQSTTTNNQYAILNSS